MSLTSQPRYDTHAALPTQTAPSTSAGADRTVAPPTAGGERWFLVAAALICLLVAGIALTLDNIRRLNDDADWVAHSHEVMDAVAGLRTRLYEAEARQRTFLLTGAGDIDSDLIGVFNAARNEIQRFKSLTVDNASQQDRVAAISDDVEALQAALRVSRDEGRDLGGLVPEADLADANRLAGAIALRLREADTEERLILQSRIRARRGSFRNALVVGLSSGLLAVLGVMAFLWAINRNLRMKTRAAAAVAQQRELYRVTLASIGDATITTDPDGIVTGMNAVAEKLTGWPVADALTRPLDEVFAIVDETTREPIVSPARRAIEESRVVDLEVNAVLIARDGTEIAIDDSAAPIRSTSGEIEGSVLVFRDVRERRQAEIETGENLAAARVLAAIVESSNTAIISKSLDGVIRSWNSAAERLFGYPPEEAIGQPIYLIVPPDKFSEEAHILACLRAGERLEYLETERMTKDGERIQVSLTVSPVFDDHGRVIGASKIARDITEEKRSELALLESEDRFRTLADNMSQLAWMADPKGSLFWYNKRWYDYTGTTLEEMQGWGWRAVQHPDHVDRVVEKVQRHWDTGEVWEDTFPLKSKDGEYRWFLSRALPIRNEAGQIVRWLGTNTDITEQRTAELALKEADERKNEFLAMLAHELRNPLAPICYGLDLIAREQAYDAEQLDVVRHQVDQMVRLIDDLLDVSRIMRGKIELRRSVLDLTALVERTAAGVEGVVRQRDQGLRVSVPEGPVWVNADTVRLSQVIGNLLNNASKYSNSGAQIDLRLEATPDKAVVSVTDNGIGIDANLLPQVFDLFTQADHSIDRSQGGLGIGLTVVKQLVELHRGTVSVHSAGTGLGSTFTVEMPLSEPKGEEAAEAAAERVPTLSLSPLRVLVVDDNVGATWMLTKLMEKLGDHEIRSAHDGPSALERAIEWRPHAALLDIGLPGMDGFELAAAIRADDRVASAYLVALTGYGQEDDRIRSQQAGFDRHLVKPASADDLEQFLHDAAAHLEALGAPADATPGSDSREGVAGG
ncbi:Sensor histidine kinase TodS [Botrimarina colliarenosi]|uniref:histidine kinase n=1 Tax=Botrimarina colliarenosi TaxID=2528001 RepID=A0A5C6ANF3_9BACT|nr:PAS domain S-box protein [Botrimarina colliarenosi]TWU00636.1 Sensor histidine kinase TodS [Botrimarina colliarenosi]